MVLRRGSGYPGGAQSRDATETPSSRRDAPRAPRWRVPLSTSSHEFLQSRPTYAGGRETFTSSSQHPHFPWLPPTAALSPSTPRPGEAESLWSDCARRRSFWSLWCYRPRPRRLWESDAWWPLCLSSRPVLLYGFPSMSLSSQSGTIESCRAEWQEIDAGTEGRGPAMLPPSAAG